MGRMHHRCSSPATSSSGSSTSHDATEDSLDGFSLPVEAETSKVVTDEMINEEKALEVEGQKAEEKRREENEKLLSEMTDDSHAKRYERLKFLLSKSTLYTEYLVGRMKTQKEEEEKRREKMAKRR